MPAARDLTKLRRMLALASDPDLVNRIVQQMSPDQALDLADEIDDTGLRDVLVRRALEDMAEPT